MVEKISIAIALEGGKEIERQLADIGQAGTKAFNQISKSAEQVGGFRNLDAANVERQLQDLGITGVREINKIQNAVKAAGRLEGLVAGITTISTAFSRLGAVVQPVGAAVEKFGATMTRALGPFAAAARALGPIGLAIGTVAAATGVLIKFATSAVATATALTELQKVTGQSFDNLSTLASVFAQGGTSVKQFASVFGNLSEKIEQAAQTKAIRDASKDAVEWANNIDQVRQKFDNLAMGVPQTFSPLTTLQTKTEAVLESLAKVQDPAERWVKLAEIFKNLGSDVERMRLGKALEIPSTMITTLNQGAASMKQLQAEAARLGLTLTTSNQQALNGLMQAWNQFTTLVGEAFKKIGAAAAPAFTNILNELKPVLTAIVKDFETLPLDQAMNKSIDRLTPAFERIGQILAPIANKIGEVLGEAVVAGMKKGIASLDSATGSDLMGKLVQPLSTATREFAIKIWDAFRKEFGGAAQAGGLEGGLGAGIQEQLSAIIEGIKNAFQNINIDWSKLTSGFSTALGTMESAASAAASNIEASLRRILSMINEVNSGLQEMQRGGQIGGDSGLPMAGGGIIGGRGTGTSDSNLAWVSRGEHIMPARTVSQPGVLAFLEALRRSGGNLRRVLDGMGRFALGGVVPRHALAFADGGIVGGGSRRTLNLTIEGRTFTGLTASESTAQSLERFAVFSQIASTGRKPSWKR